MTAPTVSVLMPHYQDAHGVELSLRSVTNQSWRGTREVVIYDDGSRPQAFDELLAVVDRSPAPVRVLRNESNRGRPFARNALLDAATGKYTAWLDAGDEWYPDKIQHQLDAVYRARLKGFDVPVWVTCNYHWQWEGGKPKLRRQNVEGDQATNLMIGNLAAYLWTTFARTEAFRNVGYFDLDLPRLQDLDFFIRFCEKGGRLIMPDTHDALCVYHKSDVGRAGEQVLECFRYIYRKHGAVLSRHTKNFRRNRELHMLMHAARFTRNNGDRAATAALLGRSALVHPAGFFKRMWKSKGQL